MGSARRLGVPTLDLVQFYWHDYGNTNYIAAAQHLGRLQREEGLVRAVGATNFSTRVLEEMLEAGAPIREHQIQYSLLDPRPERDMVPFCLVGEGVGYWVTGLLGVG